MELSDAQIERFSRQIILPEIGGVGQQRLLAATVAIGGRGEAMATAARYLAGAGIGHLTLHGEGREPLATALAELGTEAQLSSSPRPFGTAGNVELSVGADLSIDDLDRAAAERIPLIAGGTSGASGWLVVATGVACAGCAARAATALDFHVPEEPLGARAAGPHADSEPLRAGRPRSRDSDVCLASPAAGVVGSLLALEAMKHLLGLGRGGRPIWLHFDARTSTLHEHSLTRAVDCVCAAGDSP